MRLRHLLFGLTCTSLLAPAAAISPQPAQVLVEDTTARLITAIRAERHTFDRNPGRLRQLVTEIVLPHFDLERMSKRVLGKNWRGASPAQRDAFIEQFRDLLVRTYATSLVEYSDEPITFLPPRVGERDSEVTIRVEVAQPGAMAIPIHYSMYLDDDAWRVYDVSVDGVSLVINYRATFAAKIREKGLDGLIDELIEHNRKGLE